MLESKKVDRIICRNVLYVCFSLNNSMTQTNYYNNVLNRIVLLILMILIACIIDAHQNNKRNTYLKGLSFKSHEAQKDERTSLSLISGKPLIIKDQFTLSFDLKLQKTSFGYINRIILNDSTSIDLFAFIESSKISFIINNEPKPCIASEIYITNDSLINNWIKVSIKISKHNIKCNINKQSITITKNLYISKIDKIFFGANKYKTFFTSDVPRMTIKDIIIKDQNDKIIRDWDLAKHSDTEIYDKVNENIAILTNGRWEIDKHVIWRKELSFIVQQINPQIAIDTFSNKVYVATVDSLFILNIKTRKIEKLKVLGGEPFIGSSSYLIFNHLTNQLISYNTNQSSFITYDFKSNKWSAEPSSIELSIHQHNRFIDTKSNRLILFGGYGDFKYSSKLSTHDLNGGDWTTFDLSGKISPRYLASLGNCGNGEFMIFGGYGSESGMQEQGSHNYYDLFKLDINKGTCVKLGALKEPQDHYNFGNSLILFRDKFYTLAYRNDLQNSYIKLFEVETKTLHYKIFEDSIPYCFLDRDSYCDMYLSDSSILYSVILQRDIATQPFKISIYSLAFPPMHTKEIIQAKISGKYFSNFTMILVCFILGIPLILIFFKYFKRYKNPKVIPNIQAKVIVNETTIQNGISIKSNKSSASIYLLGEFRAIDSEGKDMTASFTLITKQLLLICILENYTFGNKLTSKRLEEAIWFEMDKFNATNNRNVNIRKLRLLLKQIGDISITIDNGFWGIAINDDCYCDFKTVITLINNTSSDKNIDKKTIIEILHIAKSGMLLPDFNFEWIDKYKSHYSYILIQVLSDATKQKNIIADTKLLIDICDVILIHDKIDEDAIKLKCKSLYNLGQKGLSKQCFTKFQSDYKQMLLVEPQLSFESIISSD